MFLLKKVFECIRKKSLLPKKDGFLKAGPCNFLISSQRQQSKSFMMKAESNFPDTLEIDSGRGFALNIWLKL
jgi:hypothetical protein